MVTLALAYDIDFANDGILAHANDNQDSVARHLHALYRAGALDAATARALIAIEDGGTFAGTLNTLGNEVAVDNQVAALLSAVAFNRALVNCGERYGDARPADAARCAFGGVSGSRLRQQATGDNTGFAANDWTLAVGGRKLYYWLLDFADTPAAPLAHTWTGWLNDVRINGVSTGERIIRTVERPAHVAKNRLGLPEEIPLDYCVYGAFARGENPFADASAPAPTTDNTGTN